MCILQHVRTGRPVVGNFTLFLRIPKARLRRSNKIVGLSVGASVHELFIADIANNVVSAFNLKEDRFVAPKVYRGSAVYGKFVHDVAYSADWGTLTSQRWTSCAQNLECARSPAQPLVGVASTNCISRVTETAACYCVFWATEVFSLGSWTRLKCSCAVCRQTGKLITALNSHSRKDTEGSTFFSPITTSGWLLLCKAGRCPLSRGRNAQPPAAIERYASGRPIAPVLWRNSAGGRGVE